MKKLWFIAGGVAAVASGAAIIVGTTTVATPPADEVAAPVVSQQIVWGKVAGGLQLGVRFDANSRIYQRGETAQFDLVARNVGEKTVKFKYFAPLFPVPFVTDENGKALISVLKSPPPRAQPLGLATLSLAPGEQAEIAKTELRIGSPLKQTFFWALDGAPGKYRVGFGVDFRFEPESPRAPLMLKSGLSALEVGRALASGN